MNFNHHLPKFLPFLVLLLLVAIFFGKTLTGQQIFVTPDFGKSDILHGEYPVKFFLAQSLKHGTLPLWNPYIATGFPQMGTITGNFNPINLIIFYLLPTPQAFNLLFAVIFLTVGLFTFLFCRTLGISRVASLFVGIIFSFSGIFVTQMVHHNLIQTLSFFPVEIYLVEMYIQKKKTFLSIIFSFVLGLQLLTGFYQLILYSLIVLSLYGLWRVFFLEEKVAAKARLLITLALAVLAGFAIAAIQLIPNWELTQLSERQGGVGVEEIKRFPYTFKHLITFFWPYLLGDPRVGTYPRFSENWGIFWENTGYLGILPLIFAFFALLWGLRRNRPIQFFLILAIISLLLMLGKNSPTFFLFKLPPLSFFRVPARWIIFFTFSLAILSGFGFEIFKRKLENKINSSKLTVGISLLILIIATTNLFLFSYNYHLRGEAKNWLRSPETVQFLVNDKSLYRIATYGSGNVWNDQFLKKGWLNAEEKYLAFREALDPNWNVVHKIDHMMSYSPVSFKRDLVINAISDENITFAKNSFLFREAARNLLDLQNVKYIISPFPVNGGDLDLVFKTQTQPQYLIYQNKSSLPRVFIAKNVEWATTIKDLQKILSSPNFDPKTTVILENDLKNHSFSSTNSSAEIIKYGNQDVEIKAQMDGDGILVLADSFYPGWKATVDGKEQEILPANINQRALILDKGEHLIKFSFQSQTFEAGAIISLLTTVILSILLFFFLAKSKRS